MDSRADLFAVNVDFHDDLVRNIPGIRASQDLFDDLSADPADWAIAIAAEGSGRLPAAAAAIRRPFDYGTVISYSFDSAHWQATRFSDGSTYGVWYGSLDIETTVYETAWHWYAFLLDSFPDEDREVVTDRRVLDVRCDALLIDLRGREKTYPDLVSRSSYAYTQQVGSYLHEQGLNGLAARSARCDGTNAAIFRPERLSNVRDRAFLTYRVNVARDTFVAQRTPGRKWLEFAPSALGPLPLQKK
ncbi:MAG: RES family NAD+ phosphorylase [Burkholderiales bacterium]|nr:RES family NAD+ phosphorylase [Burkholderiales bacterium]